MDADVTVTFADEIDNLDKQSDEYVPLYKMVANNKIAISKKEGVLWYQRLQLARKRLDKLSKEWEENVSTYMGQNKPRADKDKRNLKLDHKEFDYENLLWSNTNAINRETIMKLPHVEMTAKTKNTEILVSPLENALNKYLGLVGNNGINMKEKLKKADIGAQLTNRGVIRLDWNDTIDSESVKSEMSKIESQLSQTGLKLETVKELEGKLFALNEQLEESGMSGLQLTLVNPNNLFIDPNSQLETGLDADWMIEKRTELKSVLQAKYGTEEGTVYAGEKGSISSAQDTKVDEIFGDEDDPIRKASESQNVTVYYIWDKLKRRVYLYEDGRWDYPLWVWEDPYQLIQFFPYFILSYNTAPYDNMGFAECSYYLPIQNQINDVNSKMKQARDRAFNVTVVDSRAKIENKDLQNLTNGKPGYVRIGIPEGKRLQDVVTGMITPGLEQGLMDKNNLYAVMQKMSSSDPTMRGEEYKTNTTNMAIQQYGGAKKIIIGVRIDSIIGYYIRIAKEVLKLMLERFSVSDWSKVLPQDEADVVINNPVAFQDLNYQFAGDDTVEPTAAMKKQEAVQLSQIMGQFAGATPAITIVMLKLMSRAFNEIVITPEDWDVIFNSLQQQQQAIQQPMPQQLAPADFQQPPQEDMINQAAMM